MSRTRYLEDFQVGERWTSRPVSLSAEDIIAFGRANDPQPMHTDPAYGAAGPFGSVIASGWQVAILSMRVFIDAGGYGKTPMLGMGIDELRWLKPVRPGDLLTVEREVVEVKRSESRPDRGTVRTRVVVRNEAGSRCSRSTRSAASRPARPARRRANDPQARDPARPVRARRPRPGRERLAHDRPGADRRLRRDDRRRSLDPRGRGPRAARDAGRQDHRARPAHALAHSAAPADDLDDRAARARAQLRLQPHAVHRPGAGRRADPAPPGAQGRRAGRRRHTVHRSRPRSRSKARTGRRSSPR